MLVDITAGPHERNEILLDIVNNHKDSFSPDCRLALVEALFKGTLIPESIALQAFCSGLEVYSPQISIISAGNKASISLEEEDIQALIKSFNEHREYDDLSKRAQNILHEIKEKNERNLQETTNKIARLYINIIKEAPIDTWVNKLDKITGLLSFERDVEHGIKHQAETTLFRLLSALLNDTGRRRCEEISLKVVSSLKVSNPKMGELANRHFDRVFKNPSQLRSLLSSIDSLVSGIAANKDLTFEIREELELTFTLLSKLKLDLVHPADLDEVERLFSQCFRYSKDDKEKRKIELELGNEYQDKFTKEYFEKLNPSL